jgi:hypothetical protein
MNAVLTMDALINLLTVMITMNVLKILAMTSPDVLITKLIVILMTSVNNMDVMLPLDAGFSPPFAMMRILVPSMNAIIKHKNVFLLKSVAMMKMNVLLRLVMLLLDIVNILTYVAMMMMPALMMDATQKLVVFIML